MRRDFLYLPCLPAHCSSSRSSQGTVRLPEQTARAGRDPVRARRQRRRRGPAHRATDLTDRLGQPVIVESRPGAGGAVGSEHVARSAPDGYTLLWGTVSTHAINASLHPNLRYDNIKDFAPITKLMEQPLLVVVPVSAPVNSLKELISHQRANPGKSTFGSPGMGTTGHLTGELLKPRSALT